MSAFCLLTRALVAASLFSLAMAAARAEAPYSDIGRKYLQCATPFYFCNGVEVKTDAEARAQCK